MEKYLKNLRPVKPYRELLVFGGGFLFLIILNIVHKPDLNGIIPNIDFFGSVGKPLSIIILGYFTGIIITMISEIYIGIVWHIIRIKEIVNDFKKYVKKLSNIKAPGIITYKSDTILSVEFELLREEYPILDDGAERIIYKQMIIKLFLGMILFLLIDISFFALTFFGGLWFLLVFLAILTLLYMNTVVKLDKQRALIAEFLHKKKIEKKNK